MDESSKTNRLRGPLFIKQYLQGTVIDIGCGNDPVCEWAEPFDLEHGDASKIASLRPHDHYDTVHSSHCLEHMADPVSALEQWWKLIKPGGYLIIVVPDEDLYEQGFWPSRFNPDHKATFRQGNRISWSPVSHDLEAMIKALPGATLLECVLHDANYDYSLQHKRQNKSGQASPWFPVKATRKILSACCKALGRQRRETLLRKFDDYCFRRFNIPIDQTAREALAQIQAIARKAPLEY